MAATYYNTLHPPRKSVKQIANLVISSAAALVPFIPAASNTSYYNDIVAVWWTNTGATNTEIILSDGTLSYSLYAPAQTFNQLKMEVASAIPASVNGVAWTAQTVASTTSVKLFAEYLTTPV